MEGLYVTADFSHSSFNVCVVPSVKPFGIYSVGMMTWDTDTVALSQSREPTGHLPAVALKNLSRKMEQLIVLLNEGSQRDALTFSRLLLNLSSL